MQLEAVGQVWRRLPFPSRRPPCPGPRRHRRICRPGPASTAAAAVDPGAAAAAAAAAVAAEASGAAAAVTSEAAADARRPQAEGADAGPAAAGSCTGPGPRGEGGRGAALLEKGGAQGHRLRRPLSFQMVLLCCGVLCLRTRVCVNVCINRLGEVFSQEFRHALQAERTLKVRKVPCAKWGTFAQTDRPRPSGGGDGARVASHRVREWHGRT